MLSALGKLVKFVIILIAIVIVITYFTGTEVSFSDNQDSTSETQKTTETNLASALNCDTGYYKNSTKTKCLKVPDNAFTYEGADAWYCKSGFLKSGEECIKKTNETISSPKSIQIPENAYATALVSRGWKCITDYEVSGNNCIRASENINDSSKQQNESSSKSTTKKVKVDSKPDKWWRSTDKFKICYHNVTEAHKANGLHDRNRTLSIKVKEEMCKIAATSTTGEGCAWLNNCK